MRNIFFSSFGKHLWCTKSQQISEHVNYSEKREENFVRDQNKRVEMLWNSTLEEQFFCCLFIFVQKIIMKLHMKFSVFMCSFISYFIIVFWIKDTAKRLRVSSCSKIFFLKKTVRYQCIFCIVFGAGGMEKECGHNCRL